jgi:hypothetical protein
MTVSYPTRRGRRVRRRRTVRFLLVLVAVGSLATAAGTWAGSRLADTPAPPPAPRTVEVGPAQLVVPGGWRSVPVERSSVAALDPRRAVAFAPTGWPSARVVVEFGAPADASLLPPALRAASPDAAQPEAARLAGQPALLYRDVAVAPADRLDITVLTTTAGVLAIGCPSGDDCTNELDAAAVPGATTLVPTAWLALGLRLPAVLKRLDRNRRAHRAALAQANALWRQARLARRLAADHMTAAAALRPSAGSVGRTLIAGLTGTATAYRALARSASHRWRGRFIAARRHIRRSEAGLRAALADVPRPSAAPAARPTAEPAVTVPDLPAPGGVPLFIFAALALLAASAGIVLGTTGAAARLRRLIG